MTVVGARPNFIKMAPLLRELQSRGIGHTLVNTGQHYDGQMSQVFFQDLHLPEPDISLGIGSASHAVQTAETMIHFDEVLHDLNPTCVVVTGGVNSTLACVLTAAKLGYPVAHLGAGKRHFNRKMPDEINRIVNDHLTDVLFTSSEYETKNLMNEGVQRARIHQVGNILIDALLAFREREESSTILSKLNLQPKRYGVITMHKPSNVDDAYQLELMVGALERIATRIPLVFPVHPRTALMLSRYNLEGRLTQNENIHAIDPLGYIDFLALMSASCMVLTDSGGVQEETTVMGVPCLTMMEHTNRPATVVIGTNHTIGQMPETIISAAFKILDGKVKQGHIPEKWDGQTAKRITDVLLQYFS